MKFVSYREKRNKENRLIRRYKVYNFLFFKIKKKVLPVLGENNKIIIGGRELTENDKKFLDKFGKIRIEGNNNIVELPDFNCLKCNIRIEGDSNKIILSAENNEKTFNKMATITIEGNNNLIELTGSSDFSCDFRVEGDSNKIIIGAENNKQPYNKMEKITIKGNNIDKLSNKKYLYCNILLEGNNNKISIGKFLAKIHIYVDMHGNWDNRELVIKDGFNLGNVNFVILGNNSKIHVGENCLFSWDIDIWVTDAHPIYDLETNERINEKKDVMIGDNVWIGKNVFVGKGGVIPSGCVIGAKSFVNKAFTKEKCIIAGIPAKIVKENIRWELYLPRE